MAGLDEERHIAKGMFISASDFFVQVLSRRLE
jgi:hypothetical protein